MALKYEDLRVPTSTYNTGTVIINDETINRSSLGATAVANPPLTGLNVHDNFLVVAHGIKDVESRVDVLEDSGKTITEKTVGYIQYNGWTDAPGVFYGGTAYSLSDTCSLSFPVDLQADKEIQIALENGITRVNDNPSDTLSIQYKMHLPSEVYATLSDMLGAIWLKGSSLPSSDNAFQLLGIAITPELVVPAWEFKVMLNGDSTTEQTVSVEASAGASGENGLIQKLNSAFDSFIPNLPITADLDDSNKLRFTGSGDYFAIRFSNTSALDTTLNTLLESTGPTSWDFWDLSKKVAFTTPGDDDVVFGGLDSTNFFFTQASSEDTNNLMSYLGLSFSYNLNSSKSTAVIYHAEKPTSASAPDLNIKANLYVTSLTAPDIYVTNFTISSLEISNTLSITSGNLEIDTGNLGVAGDVSLGTTSANSVQTYGSFINTGYENLIETDASTGAVTLAGKKDSTHWGEFIVQPDRQGSGHHSIYVSESGNVTIGKYISAEIGYATNLTADGNLDVQTLVVKGTAILPGESSFFDATDYTDSSWAGSSRTIGYTGTVKANYLEAVAGATLAVLDVTGAAEFSSTIRAPNLASSGSGTPVLLTSEGDIKISSSDIRLKRDVQPILYGLDDILKLNPVSFKWKNLDDSQKLNLGFIAQELREIIPEVVFGDESKEMLSINMMYLTPVIVEAIKVLNNKINDLKKIVGLE